MKKRKTSVNFLQTHPIGPLPTGIGAGGKEAELTVEAMCDFRNFLNRRNGERVQVENRKQQYQKIAYNLHKKIFAAYGGHAHVLGIRQIYRTEWINHKKDYRLPDIWKMVRDLESLDHQGVTLVNLAVSVPWGNESHRIVRYPDYGIKELIT